LLRVPDCQSQCWKESGHMLFALCLCPVCLDPVDCKMPCVAWSVISSSRLEPYSQSWCWKESGNMFFIQCLCPVCLDPVDCKMPCVAWSVISSSRLEPYSQSWDGRKAGTCFSSSACSQCGMIQ
ncbi:hypothetical protein BaRGS_00021839, partial [Batillaria attramentaria]